MHDEDFLRDPGKRALVTERRARREAEHRVKKLERKLALAQRELDELRDAQA